MDKKTVYKWTPGSEGLKVAHTVPHFEVHENFKAISVGADGSIIWTCELLHSKGKICYVAPQTKNEHFLLQTVKLMVLHVISRFPYLQYQRLKCYITGPTRRKRGSRKQPGAPVTGNYGNPIFRCHVTMVTARRRV